MDTMFVTLAQASYSAMAVTMEAFLKVGYPRVVAVVNLLRFPLDVLGMRGPRHPPRRATATIRPGHREQACPEPEILAAFIDRNLTPDERVLTEAHLVQCEVCRRTLALTVKSAAPRKHARLPLAGPQLIPI